MMVKYLLQLINSVRAKFSELITLLRFLLMENNNLIGSSRGIIGIGLCPKKKYRL